MRPKEHANLLSIFSWVYAGIQAVIVLLFLLYIVLFGGMGIYGFLTQKNSDLYGFIVIGILVLIFAFLMAFGFGSMIANIQLGRQLRSDTPPTQKRIVITAILNFLSFLCGGIMLLPFGTALGVYEIWFSQSDTGKAFLEGRDLAPSYAFPPNPQYYPVNQPTQNQGGEPYKWQ